MLGHMTALSALVPRFGYAARWRVGLLTLVVVCAAGNGASGSSSSADNVSSGSGDSPRAGDFREARTYVDAHNIVRAAVQKPAGYAGPWAPIPPVTWSDEVASSAQAWAEHLHDTMDCGLMHDPDSDYGENLAAGRKVDAESAVRMWAGEIDNYRYSPKYAFDKHTGHYTQMVWRKTTQIGCGRAKCGRDSVIVCRYSPHGNHIGRAPY
jgi:hypothetical protein